MGTGKLVMFDRMTQTFADADGMDPTPGRKALCRCPSCRIMARSALPVERHKDAGFARPAADTEPRADAESGAVNMVEYAVKTPLQHGAWQEFLDIWRATDGCEAFAQAWVFDHFYSLGGDIYPGRPPHGPCLESWTVLAALAQATSRIRIGSMVNGMHYRHPAVTANMAASLDIISGGRLDLGMGAGWHVEESDAYGIELGSLKERFDRFEEGIEVIISLLTQDVTDFEGRYYKLSNARCEPKGVQCPHPPLLIGGKGRRRTLAMVARWAQKWDTGFPSVTEWHDANEALIGHCEAIGRDPTEIKRTVHIAWDYGADPSELADQAAELVQLGADQVIFNMQGPYSAAEVEPLGTELTRR